MKNTAKLAICAIMASLSVVVMIITGLIPIGTYAAPCLAGVLLCVIVLEAGYPCAISVYIAVSVLAFLLSADKEAALYYTAFFGFYPILKGLYERIRLGVLQYILKFATFNLAMVVIFFVSIGLLDVPKESFELFGVYLPWVFLIIGNFVFLLYDFAVTRLITQYLNNWRNKLKIR